MVTVRFRRLKVRSYRMWRRLGAPPRRAARWRAKPQRILCVNEPFLTGRLAKTPDRPTKSWLQPWNEHSLRRAERRKRCREWRRRQRWVFRAKSTVLRHRSRLYTALSAPTQPAHFTDSLQLRPTASARAVTECVSWLGKKAKCAIPREKCTGGVLISFPVRA